MHVALQLKITGKDGFFLSCRHQLITVLFLFFTLTRGFSEAAGQDSIPAFLPSIYDAYFTKIGKTSPFYNGAEYEGSYPMVLGSPFWKNSGVKNGIISYEGVVYYNVPLAFDLVRGDVLVKGKEEQRLRLNKEKLDYFLLDGHRFVYIPADTVSNNAMPEGIYDLLYDGEIKVYARRLKFITRGLHADERDRFSTRTAYFLFKDNSFYTISKEKDVQKIFPEEHRSFKTFRRENKLNFKKDPETFIVKTVAFWELQKK